MNEKVEDEVKELFKEFPELEGQAHHLQELLKYHTRNIMTQIFGFADQMEHYYPYGISFNVKIAMRERLLDIVNTRLTERPHDRPDVKSAPYINIKKETE